MECSGFNACSLYIECKNIQRSRKGALKGTRNKQYKLLLRKISIAKNTSKDHKVAET